MYSVIGTHSQKLRQLCPHIADSGSTVHGGPKKNWKIKEINGSQFSKSPPSKNGL
jgi:hypothetical protein